jgi:undecaprenyl pyrophosphate synthase
MSNIFEDINKKFKGKQKKGIEAYLKDLGKRNTQLGLDDNKITQYITHLENLKIELDKLQPQEMWSHYALLVTLIVWIAIWVYGKHKYDQFMTPSIQRWIPIGNIKFLDPEVLALITPVSQKFTQTGERTDKLFTPTGNNTIMDMAKELANIAQSKTIIMNVEWDVEVAFDFQNYEMTFDGKRLTLYLDSPEYRVTKTQSFVKKNNRELIPSKALNQTEQELLEDLKKMAIDETKKNKSIEKMAKEQLSKILMNLYSPIDNRLEWVDIIIRWNWNNETNTFRN